MFIRPCYRRKNGKRHAYWVLVESVRTANGPRQRIVSYLGQMDTAGRLGVQATAEGGSIQRRLFEDVEPAWVDVDARRIRGDAAASSAARGWGSSCWASWD